MNWLSVSQPQLMLMILGAGLGGIGERLTMANLGFAVFIEGADRQHQSAGSGGSCGSNAGG